jgi:hypothetical protein
MSKSRLPDYTFTGVSIYKRNSVWLRAIGDDLSEQGIDHAVIFRWLDGAWAQRPVGSAVRATGFLDKPELTVFNMCIDGEIVIFTFPGERTEVVDASEEGPSDLVNLRDMRLIGDHFYVVGMARRAYRRDKPDSWVPIDQGVFVPRGSRRKAVGFNSLDGTDEKNIYAVGYKGEIWFYDGKNWDQQDSPTNVALNVVRCLSREEIYVCGMAGTVIRGVSGQWQVIEQDVTKKDFWGMALFQGQIYVSNDDGIFVIRDGGLVPVKMGLKKKISTAYLDAADGVLWSVGDRDAAYTDDGVNWTVVNNP